MKKFWTFFGIAVAVFTAVLGALAVFDRITQKNRIKDGYLNCGSNEEHIEEE